MDSGGAEALGWGLGREVRHGVGAARLRQDPGEGQDRIAALAQGAVPQFP